MENTLGVTVGAYWEIFEWFFFGKYAMADTISDLLVDSGGALAATLVALRGVSHVGSHQVQVQRTISTALLTWEELLNTARRAY